MSRKIVARRKKSKTNLNIEELSYNGYRLSSSRIGTKLSVPYGNTIQVNGSCEVENSRNGRRVTKTLFFGALESVSLTNHDHEGLVLTEDIN